MCRSYLISPYQALDKGQDRKDGPLQFARPSSLKVWHKYIYLTLFFFIFFSSFLFPFLICKQFDRPVKKRVVSNDGSETYWKVTIKLRIRKGFLMYACKAHNFLERHHICFLIEAENVQRVYILAANERISLHTTCKYPNSWPIKNFCSFANGVNASRDRMFPSWNWFPNFKSFFHYDKFSLTLTQDERAFCGCYWSRAIHWNITALIWRDSMLV